MAPIPAAQAPPGKLLFQEGSMLGGSFTMVRFYDLEQEEEEASAAVIRLVVADRATSATAQYDFDAADLASLDAQLKCEGETTTKSKPFLKALSKCLVVQRSDSSLTLSFKGVVLLSPEEKLAKQKQQEAEQLERELAEQEEQARLQRALEERLEQERLAKERELQEEERIANLTPEEREREAQMKNSAYLDQLTLLIDLVDEANDVNREFVELTRPAMHSARRRQKARAASTFKKMEAQEHEREELARQPKGQVDQEWDDPLELLAEYKRKTQEQHVAKSVFQQLSEMQRKQQQQVTLAAPADE